MKSERRHELQQNELADWLGEKIEALRPYGTQIALGVTGAIVALLLGIWLFRGDDSVAASSWSSYFSALNVQRERGQALEEVSKNLASPGLWAKMSIADAAAQEGGRAMFTDRNEAKKQLDKAKAAYEAVESGARDAMLKARAQLGLAKVYESLCKPEEAKSYYEKAAEGLKGTALGKAAAADAARMKNPDQVALLEWFAAQTPKRPAPFPGMGGSIPGLPNDLPARPDLSVPNFGTPGGLGLDNIGTGTPTAPGPELPLPGTTTPGTTTPGATTPGTTTPGTTTPPEATPAPGTPAPGTPATTPPSALPESPSAPATENARPAEPKAQPASPMPAKSDVPQSEP
jgi:hypothetical protein